jgi:hypothetical protein
MATLLRPPEELDAKVRESAHRQEMPIHTWWLQAAAEKLDREQMDVRSAARLLNQDPVTRWVLDRLGE